MVRPGIDWYINGASFLQIYKYQTVYKKLNFI